MEEENKETVIVGLEKVPLKTEREEKKKKRKRIVLIVLLCVFLLITGFVGGYLYTNYIHPTKNSDVKNTFGEIEAMLENYWVYNKNYDNLQNELENKAFYGMTSFEEDPYTTYMSPIELDEFTRNINMNYVGIGVQYSIIGDAPLIEKVFKDSPAEKAGILPGDILYKIDGNSVEGLSTDEIKDRVLGEASTNVTITLIRNGKEIDLTVTRDTIDNSVYCYVENDYVVMELASFGAYTAKECIKYLDNYKNYEKIIIDLRDDTGGYQTAVKEIAGLFIGDEKVYLRQKNSQGIETADYTDTSVTYDNFKKIIILVNENTASAAEVLAICLREQLNNVKIVGTTTYGKGVIQSTHYLLNDGVLKFTSYYWYSPNGRSINGVGIVPDVEVKLADIAYDYRIEMNKDDEIVYDTVSEQARVVEKALEFLDYDIDRKDGYFDEQLKASLIKYQEDYGLTPNGIIDYKTYNSVITSAIMELNNKEKDIQFKKAIELLAD